MAIASRSRLCILAKRCLKSQTSQMRCAAMVSCAHSSNSIFYLADHSRPSIHMYSHARPSFLDRGRTRQHVLEQIFWPFSSFQHLLDIFLQENPLRRCRTWSMPRMQTWMTLWVLQCVGMTWLKVETCRVYSNLSNSMWYRFNAKTVALGFLPESIPCFWAADCFACWWVVDSCQLILIQNSLNCLGQLWHWAWAWMSCPSLQRQDLMFIDA